MVETREPDEASHLPPVTVTLDMEDLRPDEALPERVVEMTHRVLDLFIEHDVRASVYVVGELAEARPDLVRRAAADGHEIGLHSWSHVPIPTRTPETFAEEWAGAGKHARRVGEACSGDDGQCPGGGRHEGHHRSPKAAHWLARKVLEQ